MIVTTIVHELTRRALGLLGTMGLAALAFTGAPVQAADGPPVILQQPVSLTARQGESAQLILAADGSVPLTITWLRNGLPLATGSNTAFSTAPLRSGDDGTVFSAIVSNTLGVVTTSNAFLTVEPGIVVAASANRTAKLVLYRGWPLVLEVALIHPDAFDSNAAPILISGTNGPWFNALQVDVRDSQDEQQSWPFHPVPITNEVVQLNSDSGGGMLWWLTPGETEQLPTGAFAITATLNTTNVTRPGAWKGLLAGVPVSAVITNEPALLDRAQTEQKGRLFADYALLQGDRDQAQREIDALLAAYPTNIGGLTYDVYLKEAAGHFDEAFRSVEKALDQVALQSPDAPEPPSELLLKEAELNQIVAPPTLEHALINEQVVLNWSGYPGLNYRLETSSDLSRWSLLTTNFTAVSNRFSFTVDLTRDRQFFRVAR